MKPAVPPERTQARWHWGRISFGSAVRLAARPRSSGAFCALTSETHLWASVTFTLHMVFDKQQVPLISALRSWPAFLNVIWIQQLTMSHLNIPDLSRAQNMSPALFPVNKTVNCKGSVKKPSPSFFIWTLISTKWLENEVEDACKTQMTPPWPAR